MPDVARTPGHIELERSIDSIVVGIRHRKDPGDIAALMRSIDEVGLLQPVTITPDGVLVCGWRRLEAARRLGLRTLNVWVRSGISDELSHVLAQHAENQLRKPLNTLEAARLYREIKLLKEEDAARRQQASRFSTSPGHTTTATAGENEHDTEDNEDNGAGQCPAPRQAGSGSDDVAGPGDPGGVEDNGAGQCPAPRGTGDSRNEAAQLVTGTQSYHRLEKVGWLEDIRDDDTRPPSVRNLARQALAQIGNGGPVDPAYRRVRAADRLARAPADPHTQPATHPGSRPDPDAGDDLGREAAEALRRVQKSARRPGPRIAPATDAGTDADADTRSSTGKASAGLQFRTPRAFVLTWTELDGWTQCYDPNTIATQVSDEEWQRFERVINESIAFADHVRELRRSLATSA